jgi:NifB/MoaA-like Fe-S oxidoreductase
MNGQIVLCKGLNDGEELRRTISDLLAFAPMMQSLSVVPVGLSKYRDGLCQLEPFTTEDARAVIQMIEEFQKLAMERFGMHFVHASDEWYINAGMAMPEEASYDGYNQIENGVGMTRLLYEEFGDAVARVEEYAESTRVFLQRLKHHSEEDKICHDILTKNKGRRVSTICGTLAYGNKTYIEQELQKIRPDVEFMIYPIVNNFFGPQITVTGLLTGGDIAEQLRGKDLGEALLIPNSCLKADEDIFLDDMTLDELQRALQVKMIIVESNGIEYLRNIIGV